MEVREARPEDWEGVLEKCKLFFVNTSMNSRCEFEEEGLKELFFQSFDSKGSQVWVVDDGKIVGFCVMIIFPLVFSISTKVAQELSWWLDPEYRGSGAGKELKEKMEQWARKQGANHMFMIALENDKTEKMKQVYEKMGFTPIERTFCKELG
jgi:GNAT superfamily N-acetyltransferase